MRCKAVLVLIFLFFILTACSDLYRGKLYYARGEYDKSYDELKVLSDKGFPEANYYVGRMIEEGRVKDKKPEECIEYYEKAYEEGYKAAALRLGFFYLNRQDYENALKWLKIAEKAGYKSAKIALIRLQLMGFDKESNVNKEKILSELSFDAANDADLMYLKGEIYEKGYLGTVMLDRALLYYKKSYEMGNIRAGLKYASILEKQENYDEALKIYEEIYYKTKNPTAAYKAGKIYENLARHIKLSYCPVTKAKTSKDYYILKLETENKKREYYAKATYWYEKADSLPEAQYRLIRITWLEEENRCGDLDVIKKYIKRNVKEAIKDYVRLYQSGTCSSKQVSTGSFITQEKQINVSHFNPDNKTIKKDTLEYYLKMAKHYEFDLFNIEEAKKYYEKACCFISPEAEISLAKLMKKENPDVSGAVFYYYSQKGDPKAMYHLGIAYFDLNENQKAVYWLKRAAKERYFPALKALVNYYFSRNETKDVVNYLESLSDMYPCFVNLKLAEVYEGTYDLEADIEKAKTYYERALLLNCPEAYYRLAWFYFYKKSSEENLIKAKNLLEEYIFKFDKDEPKALCLLGRVYLALGNKKKAIEYLYKATQKGYIISNDEVKLLLTKYKKIENIYPVDSGGKPLIYLSEFMFDRDPKASICFAYKAAEQNVPGSALLLLKKGLIIKHRSDYEFLKRIQYNPKVCDRYLKMKFKNYK